jgi:outer membrane protein OmpA-like peptidoglycan-associated protein
VPFSLAFLGRQVRESGLDLNGFTLLLANEKDSIMRAAPPGLSAALGVETPRASMTDREIAFQSDRRTTASDYGIRQDEPNPSSGNKWLWPTLATLAILALIWGSRARHRTPSIDTSSAAGEVASPTMPAPSAPISTPGSGAMPDTSSFAPGGPIETTLAAFINDSTQHPSASTRFDFDRLVFVSNSSKMLPQSEDQVKKVAMILKAHPNVIVRISGYADSAGTAATNMKLAAARAAVVRAALIRDGVAASHLQSQREQSMADTSAGAALGQNQHVSLLVIKK